MISAAADGWRMPTTTRSARACSIPRRATAISMAARSTSAAISAAMATAPDACLRKTKRPPGGGLFHSVLRETRLDHDHLGADLDLLVEVDDVLVAHADAAGRHRLSDRPRLVGAVDAVERRAEIHGAGAQRILRPAGHEVRQVRTALQHLRRRRPVRPFLLGRDFLLAGPGEARLADADAVAERGAVVLHQEEEAVRRVDDDGAGRLRAGVGHDLLLEFRIDLEARIDRFGLLGRLAARQHSGRRTRRRDRAAAAEQKLDEAAA